MVANYGGTPTVNAVFTGKNNAIVYPKEYNTAGVGYAIPNTNYTRFGATYELTDAITAADFYYARLHFGFVQGSSTDQAAEIFLIQPGSMYLGLEYAYDMKTTVTGETTIPEGTEATLTVDADVINQVGSTGYLSQGVTWLAMDAARREFVSGIEITNGANGAATVSVGEDVPAGKYYLVAVAGADSQIVKSVEINVESSAPVVEELAMTQAGGKITIATPSALTAKLIVVTYDANNKMAAAPQIFDVNLAANGTEEFAPTITRSSTMKAMLWYDTEECIPVLDALDY